MGRATNKNLQLANIASDILAIKTEIALMRGYEGVGQAFPTTYAEKLASALRAGGYAASTSHAFGSAHKQKMIFINLRRSACIPKNV